MTKTYCTVEDIELQVRLDADKYGLPVDDLIIAASQSIDNYCKRKDGFIQDEVASTRQFVGFGNNWILIDETPTIDLVEVRTSITGDYVAWNSSDWIAFSGSNRNPNFNTTPYNKIMVNPSLSRCFTSSISKSNSIPIPTVRVTAKWGYSVSIPPVIKQACITQVTRSFKRAQSGWADAIANSEFQELRFVRKIDSYVEHLLQNFMIKPTIGKNSK